MDYRLCEMYRYGKHEGAQGPIHYCMYYNDALTEMKGVTDRYPRLCLYRNGKIEVDGAWNCEHYIDRDFHWEE